MKGTIWVFILALVLVGVGFSTTLIPLFTKPADRDYTWVEGYSDDYVGYVSYVKEGMYGRNYVVVRSLPIEKQSPNTIHLLYIAIGKIGGLTRLTAPVIFHTARVLFGLLYVFVVYRFFLALFKGFSQAFSATLLAFLSSGVSWYTMGPSGWVYHTLGFFNFGTNFTLRVLSRPHYELGGSLFLVISLAILYGWKVRWGGKYLSLILASLLGIIHATFGLILFMSLVLFVLVKIVTKRLNLRQYINHLLILISLLIGLGLSYYSTTLYPWVHVYKVTERLSWELFFQYILYFGPLLWVGYIGLLFTILKKRLKDDISIFLFIWVSLQLSFFFFFSPYIKFDSVRFIQSLYYIPLSYGTMMVINYLGDPARNASHSDAGGYFKWKYRLLLVLVIIALSFSMYIHDYDYSLHHTSTDFHSYSSFIFPSKNITAAYAYLDKNTPRESGVLARFEAANNIFLYSHNRVVGNYQSWGAEEFQVLDKERNEFYWGAMDKKRMRDFLEKYDIEYIYSGFQEGGRGVLDGNPDLFGPVFSNMEVSIYKVI